MLAQSGVGDGGTADAPAPAAPGEIVIRSIHHSGEGEIFAACGPGERLIGGGCDGGYQPLRASFPMEGADHRTIGGRWHCTFGRTREGYQCDECKTAAYALCQGLEAAPPGP